jgi:serine/threonine-protein kinase
MPKVSYTPKLDGMKYRVVGELGTGAGTTILQISDKMAGKRFALKVVRRLDSEDDIYIDQARVEYAVSQLLNHPNIVKIYDLRIKRSWFRITGVELLEEYVDGKTLDEIEAPEMGQLVLIFNQVASALVQMHQRGVYHGDLKPSNIMLSKTGQVKLIDLGTAWIRGEEKDRIQGTPQYMAPEQALERVVNERTDIYNFGATVYRMFTGRFAQQGLPKSGKSKARRVVPSIQSNPKIPGTLNETIMACLEVAPERRPANMSEIEQQLAAVAKDLGLDEMDLKGAEDEEF